MKKLHLGGKPPRSQGKIFEAVAKNLVNLRSLYLESEIYIAGLLVSFSGRLLDFAYWPPVYEDVVEFLLRQPDIERAYFKDLNLHWCRPAFLPHLRRVQAPPQDLAVLVGSCPIEEIYFLYQQQDYNDRPVVPFDFVALSTAHVYRLWLQVSQLVGATPDPQDLITLLPWVQQLVITQDLTWGTPQDPAVSFPGLLSSRFRF